MSAEPDPSTPTARIRRMVGQGNPPAGPPSAIRVFLDRHLALFLALSVGVGFGCGALAAFVNGLNSEEFPFLEWSVGLYVTPPVLLGWVAVRSWLATVAGTAAYLSAVLGHLVTAHLAADDYNVLEYRAWVPVGLAMGALLGFLGNRIRSRTTAVRVFSAGLPFGLMAVFLWGSVHAQMETEGKAVHLGGILLDAGLALFVLALCRGWAARFKALVCAVALAIPLVFGQFSLFLLVWFASGDY